MIELDTIGQRLQYAVKQSPLTIKAIAHAAGVSTQAIHQAIKKNAMTDENLEKIATITDVSEDWLKTGGTNSVNGIDAFELTKAIDVMTKAAKDLKWNLPKDKIVLAALRLMEEK